MKREQASKAAAHSERGKNEQVVDNAQTDGDQKDRFIGGDRAIYGEYLFQDRPVRTVSLDQEPWFVHADICDRLGIGTPAKALARLEPDEKGVTIIHTLGGTQTVNVINESGLFALILTSRKPEARAFRRWVTSDVLPQIRRTGSYSANGQIGQDGSVVLPPLDGETRYVVVGIPGKPPHIRRTGPAEMLAENTSLDIQGLCYALKNIEVWWNKLQILGRSASARDEGFSAHMVEKAIVEGGVLADKYLGLMKYLSAAE